MKRLVFISLSLVIILFSFHANARNSKVTLKATVKTVENNGIPHVYVRIRLPDNPKAVDSLFSDEQGNIVHELPFSYFPVSVDKAYRSDIITHKIHPNIITSSIFDIQLDYNYPLQGKIHFIDMQGRIFDNRSELSPGMYFYFLDFTDGMQSGFNKIIVAEKTIITINLRNIYSGFEAGNTKKSDNQRKFIAEFIKDGYITHWDTINIDSTFLEGDYMLEKAELPSAAFEISGNTTVGSAVVFDGSASAGTGQEALVYSWDFGDGKRGQSKMISHIYNSPGTYNVRLTVTGKWGAKHYVTKAVTIDPGPVAEGFDGVVYGYVQDPDQSEISGAFVELMEGNAEAITDNDGVAALYNLPVGIPLHFRIKKQGYVDQMVSVIIPKETKEAHFFSTLKSRSNVQILVNAEFGGRITGEDGSSVVLPHEALTYPDGSIVRGNVNVYITPVDVVFETSAFPGTFMAYRSDGEDGVLLSYGVSEIVFQQNNEDLRIAEGKTATILIPVYTSGAQAGDLIPLWSINEDNGIWVEEGTGTIVESNASPTGLALQAQIGHMSWWNCDDFKDDRKRDGLCWRWECTTARCYKVKVGCWMEGAQRGPMNSRKKANDSRDDFPPVFEVRDFVPAEGKKLMFPVDRDVYIEARAFNQQGELLAGSVIVPAIQEEDTFSIELTPVLSGDTLDLSLNELVEVYLNPEEYLNFRVLIPEEKLYVVYLNRGDDPYLLGSYVIKSTDRLISSSTINGISENVFIKDLMYISVVGNNSVAEGNFRIGVFEPEEIALTDSIADSLTINKNFHLYGFESEKNTILTSRFYKIKSTSGTGRMKLLSPTGMVLAEEYLRMEEQVLTAAIVKDSMHYVNVTGPAICDYVMVTEEDQASSVAYGDTLIKSIEFKGDIDMYNFEGSKDELISVKGTLPQGSSLSYSAFKLWNEDGKEIAQRNIRYNNNFNDYEILYKLPENGTYSVIVYTTYPDTGKYQIALNSTPYTTLNIDELREMNVDPKTDHCFEFNVPEEKYIHFSVLSDNGGGEFIIWNENGKRMNDLNNLRYYHNFFSGAFSDILPEGKYYVTIRNDNASKLFINLAEIQPLSFDEKGKSSIADTINEPHKVNAYRFSAAPGDGFHGILKIRDESFIPHKAELIYYPLSSVGTSMPYQRHQLDFYSLDSTILHESAGKIVEDEQDTCWIMIVHSDSAGSYQLIFHHVTASDSIAVDDDFKEHPDAQTSSHIAAGYAVRENGSIFLSNGEYPSYLPLRTQEKNIRLQGQEKENVLIKSVRSYYGIPAVSFYSDNCRISDITINCGTGNYYALEVVGDNSVVENIDIKPMEGQEMVAGVVKGRGSDVTFRNINIQNSHYGLDVSSLNGIIEDCNLTTNRCAIALNAENITVRNNTVTIKEDVLAIDVNSSNMNGMGNQIVENNHITIEYDLVSYNKGAISIARNTGPGNATTSYIRNNSITSASMNTAFFAGTTSYPGSAIIIENNKYHCTNSKGGRALFLNAGRAAGTAGMIVRNNIFEGLAANDAIYISGADLIGEDQKFVICNNSFRIAPGSEINADYNFINTRLFYSTFADTANLYLVNNIFTGNGSGSFIKFQKDYSLYSDYNIIYNFSKKIAGVGTLIGTSHDLTSNPQYTDNELHVAAGSPAIDSGASPAEFDFVPGTDIEGTTRPRGSGYDIGAYEGEGLRN